MKIAAIALASALAAIAISAPSFAQSGSFNDRDQAGPMQYGPGGQNQFRGGVNRDRDGFGMRDNWRRDDNSRTADNDDWRGGWRRDDGMRGHMGMMGPRMHGRFAQEGASFSFGNGRARMAVHCPANESVETCVRAASQLLDKITSLRSGTSAATPGSSSTGSGATDNSPAVRPGSGTGSSGSSSGASSGGSSTGDDE